MRKDLVLSSFFSRLHSKGSAKLSYSKLFLDFGAYSLTCMGLYILNLTKRLEYRAMFSQSIVKRYAFIRGPVFAWTQ